MAVKHDIDRLSDPDIKEQYTIAVVNKFEVLLDIKEEEKRANEIMSHIINIFLQTAEENLGKRKGKEKEALDFK